MDEANKAVQRQNEWQKQNTPSAASDELEAAVEICANARDKRTVRWQIEALVAQAERTARISELKLSRKVYYEKGTSALLMHEPKRIKELERESDG